MKITATKDGVTRGLSNMVQVNAFGNAGYEITVNGKRLYANGKRLYNTAEINAFLNSGYTLGVDGETPPPEPTEPPEDPETLVETRAKATVDYSTQVLDEMDKDALKARADALGITYSPNIGESTLRDRIREALEKGVGGYHE